MRLTDIGKVKHTLLLCSVIARNSKGKKCVKEAIIVNGKVKKCVKEGRKRSKTRVRVSERRIHTNTKDTLIFDDSRRSTVSCKLTFFRVEVLTVCFTFTSFSVSSVNRS